jgi:hypothetical protein
VGSPALFFYGVIMSDLEKSEELGTPSYQHKVKLAKEEKQRQEKYKIKSEKTVTKNGKILKLMTMSDGSTKQVFVGLAKNKKKS